MTGICFQKNFSLKYNTDQDILAMLKDMCFFNFEGLSWMDVVYQFALIPARNESDSFPNTCQ